MQAVAGQPKTKPVVANIDVGMEPLAYCLLSPDCSRVLSCDDDGQLELWTVSGQCMLRRFDIGTAAKRAAFTSDGNTVVCCCDYDAQVQHWWQGGPWDTLQHSGRQAADGCALGACRFRPAQLWGLSFGAWVGAGD